MKKIGQTTLLFDQNIDTYELIFSRFNI